MTINKYFGFLTRQLEFNGPFEYSLSRERHYDFVRKNVVVKIVYDGEFWVEVFKTNQIIPELQTGQRKIIDVKNKRRLSIQSLDKKKKLWHSVSSDNFPDKELWYNAKLIRLNPEVLEGDFSKTCILNRFKKLVKQKN